MGEFQKQRTYSGQFSDIRGKWYETYIADLYEYGLAQGMSESTMAPDESVTVAQIVTLAARINAKYYDGEIGESAGEWYEPYISYAYEYGLIEKGEFEDFNRPATRRESVLIFSRTLPGGQLGAVNEVRDYSDVSVDTDWALYTAVKQLDQAGVIEGYEDGSFRPDGGISRAEAMTIADKLVNKSQRRGYTEARPTEPGWSGDSVGTDNKWYANKFSGTFMDSRMAMVNADFENGNFTMAIAAGYDGGIVTLAGVCETTLETDGSLLVNCVIKDHVSQGGAGEHTASQASAITALAFTYDGGMKLTLREAVVDKKVLNSSSATTAQPVVYVVGLLYIGQTLTAAN